MDGAINDVDSLKKFREEMIETADNLKEQLKRTEIAIEVVAKDWKDPQFTKFNDEFEQDKEKIKPLCKAIEEFESDVLYPLEVILRKYLAL